MSTENAEPAAGKGWKPHAMRQRNGIDGWELRPAELRFLHYQDDTSYMQHKAQWFCPFGVVQMDNGELVLAGSTDFSNASANRETVAISFSSDGGEAWSPLREIGAGIFGRPIGLTYVGKGELTFTAADEKGMARFFSSDYGRTWTERAPAPVQPSGLPICNEGNNLVDYDADGVATRIMEFGWMLQGEEDDWAPTDASIGVVHWSEDGGRTWSNRVCPQAWFWDEEYEGRTYRRGVSEGSLVRAGNGWIVAALRMDMAPRFIDFHNDNLEGTGVSVSKDDGVTWSPIRTIYPAGRMHAHLLRLPDGVLVMSFIQRQDVHEGRLASYLRGCGAVLSYDNGLTWDTDHDYLLDCFEFDDCTPHALACGHLCSTLLDDGSILTCYGRYPSKGGCLVKWKPAVRA